MIGDWGEVEWLLAQRIAGGKLESSIEMLNAYGKAVGYDQGRTYDGSGRHIIDCACDENLRHAKTNKITTLISRHEKGLDSARISLRARVSAGRSRGAGAGGYNRDVGNIEHKIALLRSAVLRLNSEIARRI